MFFWFTRLHLSMSTATSFNFNIPYRLSMSGAAHFSFFENTFSILLFLDLCAICVTFKLLANFLVTLLRDACRRNKFSRVFFRNITIGIKYINVQAFSLFFTWQSAHKKWVQQVINLIIYLRFFFVRVSLTWKTHNMYVWHCRYRSMYLCNCCFESCTCSPVHWPALRKTHRMNCSASLSDFDAAGSSNWLKPRASCANDWHAYYYYLMPTV